MSCIQNAEEGEVKMSRVKIKSDGSIQGTEITVDGNKIGGVSSVELAPLASGGVGVILYLKYSAIEIESDIKNVLCVDDDGYRYKLVKEEIKEEKEDEK